MRDGNSMTDNERQVRLLESLRAEPAAPSRIDVQRAMSDGLRRRRVRRWSGGAAIATVTVAVAVGGAVVVQATGAEPGPPTAGGTTVAASAAPKLPEPKDCTIHRLPTGGVDKAIVSAGDPSGHYLAGRVYPPGGHPKTVVWKDGRLQGGGTVPGEDADIYAINSAGVGVGSAYAGDNEYPYVVRNGTSTRLKGGTGSAMGISADGVVVGGLGGNLDRVPVRWSSADAEPTRLRLPAGATGGEVRAIGEDGTLIGVVQIGKDERGYIWPPDGTGSAVPPATVDGQTGEFVPFSMAGGWVYGSVSFALPGGGDRITAARLRVGTSTYESLMVGPGEQTFGATNGWVLGTAAKISDSASAVVPAIAVGGHVVELPVDPGAHHYLVSSFSADGHTAGGYSSDASGKENTPVRNRAFMWTCH
jgi:hypothetical protein